MTVRLNDRRQASTTTSTQHDGKDSVRLGLRRPVTSVQKLIGPERGGGLACWGSARRLCHAHYREGRQNAQGRWLRGKSGEREGVRLGDRTIVVVRHVLTQVLRSRPWICQGDDTMTARVRTESKEKRRDGYRQMEIPAVDLRPPSERRTSTCTGALHQVNRSETSVSTANAIRLAIAFSPVLRVTEASEIVRLLGAPKTQNHPLLSRRP